MPNALQIAGSGTSAKYGVISQMRLFTGLWTQRSPLRDAATSYIFERFYGATRFDSLIAGSNVEITSRLTLARRPGLSVFNSQSFPTINAFGEFHQFSANSTTIRVMADTANTIYDATGPSTKTAIFTKSAGAGQTYFQGVGNTLYMGDGIDQIKWVQSSISWAATTAFTAGQYIIDPNNNIQQVTTGGTSGGSQPVWNVTVRGTTTDSGVTWTNRGASVNVWQEPAPLAAPSIPLINSTGANFWSPGKSYTSTNAGGSNGAVILDTNGNFQIFYSAGALAPQNSGTTLPTWNTTIGAGTADNNVTWYNGGQISQGWQPSTLYNFRVIIDSNGNLQWAHGGISGTTQPTWATTLLATTTDGTVSWVNEGPVFIVSTGAITFGYSHHLVDGGVTTLSPTTTIGPILSSTSSNYSLPQVSGSGSNDGQVDFIWLYRTTRGGVTLLFDQQIVNTGGGPSSFNVSDTNPDSALVISNQAPINHVNDPPPAGFIGLTYHLSRIWGFVGNSVYYSNAPLAAPGVNTEQFPPASVFVFPSSVVKLLPTAVGLLVFTQSDIFVIGGQGTSTSPLYAIPYLPGYGLRNYNALDVNGSAIYMFTTQNQLISLDPSAGVSEIGFPIGDVLNTFSPNNAYVSWYSGGSGDTALYITDGSTGWFRMNPTPAPESGLTWSPKATIVGGCKAVQQLETTPGVHKLLVGGTGTGPILQRDLTVNQDNGTSFTANATLGSIVLALPSQIAELLFIESDSIAVGSHPSVSVLMGEISGTFESLPSHVPDPPILAASTSLYSDRFYLSQGPNPAVCRHFQLQFSWPAENFHNELLSFTLVGSHHTIN